ncbi:Xaa-Arg dipeptidase, partial [Phenoliferia sp. Uapishka_3]
MLVMCCTASHFRRPSCSGAPDNLLHLLSAISALPSIAILRFILIESLGMPSYLSPLLSYFKKRSSPPDWRAAAASRPFPNEKQVRLYVPESDPVASVGASNLPTYIDATTAFLPVPENEIATLSEAIDKLNGELRTLSLYIHDNPEVAWKEIKAHDALTKFMEEHGFRVTRHAYGLATAWEATFEHGSGGPVVGFNSEMDALPGIGHGCGHHLIAISGVAAALAISSALTKFNVSGKVILLGTPAEELEGGKINLINAGAYKPMDVCMILHPCPTSEVSASLAIAECTVEYTGHTAHAAGAPWDAINAQDAAVLAYINISALRQQIHPTHRVHGVIINKNWVQNVIPGTAKIVFGVRAPTMAEVELLKARVVNCFKAAALATGCNYKNTWTMAYADQRQNTVLREFYKTHMVDSYGVDFTTKASPDFSSDFGNVSYELPVLAPSYQIPCEIGSGNHTVGFTAASALPEAHRLTLEAAKGVSVTTWKFITDPRFAASIRKEYDETKGKL